MKKIALTFFVIFLSKALFAFDSFQINPYLGLNYASIQEYDKLKLGYQVGVLGRFGKKAYIGTGVSYGKLAVIMEGNTFSMSGTQIPLLFGIKAFEKNEGKLRLGFGPALTFVNKYKLNEIDVSEGKHHYLWISKFEVNWSKSFYTIGLDYDLGITPIIGGLNSRFNRLSLNFGLSF